MKTNKINHKESLNQFQKLPVIKSKLSSYRLSDPNVYANPTKKRQS